MFDTDVIESDAPVARLILGHGAGAGKQSDFMQDVARRLSAVHIEVVLFDFPYMQTITETGKRRPPDKADKLQSHFKALKQHIDDTRSALPTFIGGKSMGGRMATLIADELDINGVVVFGYPFHPPGKPEKTRTDHLGAITTPVCIIQGERDTFGPRADIQGYDLGVQVKCHFLEDGDHSLKPRKKSGFTHEHHIEQACNIAQAFIKKRSH